MNIHEYQAKVRAMAQVRPARKKAAKKR